MSKWFFINILILLFAIWKLMTGYHGIHMVIGITALGFILYNWTRHAVFTSIRSKQLKRESKIKLANISKQALPIHKWTGTTALIVAIVHMFFVLYRFGWILYSYKMLSGVLAVTILFFMVASGWLRWYRTTVFRRFLHWTLGFILIFSIIIHLIF